MFDAGISSALESESSETISKDLLVKETVFKPAVWRNSLSDLQKAIKLIEPDEVEDHVDNELPGLLTFDNGLSLVLDIPYGTLIEKKCIELSNGVKAYTGEYADINNVFGFSQNGKWYVLKNVFVSNCTESFPGFPTQRIEGNSLIVSSKPIQDNPPINQINLELDGFTEWFRNFNLTRKYEMNKDEEGNYTGYRKIAHEYEPPDAYILYQNDNFVIEVVQTGTELGGPAINPEASLSVVSKLLIRYSQPIGLEEAIENEVHRLRELISLFAGVFCSIETIQAFSSDEQLAVDYYAPFIRRESEITNDEVMHMPLPFPELEGKTSGIVEKWFGLCPDAANAANILVSRLDGSVMPCDLTFIACASAFEALSRVEVNQECFEQEKFDAYMNNIFDSTEDGDFKEWLKRQVHNRRSASSLARALLKQLKPFSSYLLPDRERFLNDHRVCRNAYVHRDGLESGAVLKSEELFLHTRAVWLLCYAAILNLLGIAPEECLDAVKKSRYQDGIISQIRRQYSK